MKINGVYVGLGEGDTSIEIPKIKELLKAKFTPARNTLDDSDLFTPALTAEVTRVQGVYTQEGKQGAPHYIPGVVNLEFKYDVGLLQRPAPPPACIYFSVCGTGVPWNVGYCYDIGEALDKTRCLHQPVGYPAAGPPSAMGPSINAGVTELIRLMDLHRCDITPWCGGGYSQGAIVWITVLMRVIHGDLGRFKAMYMGSVCFGNPSRQAGSSFPGCVDVPGQGIAQPNATNTPTAHWDFSNVKTMVNSTGDDFYATMDGEADNSPAAADSRAVWAIIRDGISGGLSLVEAVAKLLLEPSFTGGVGAAEAIFYALDFFVVQGISPHTSYGVIQPIVGDSRDAWTIALNHIQDLVARLPVGAAG